MTVSKPIKGFDTLPKDVLFKTHSYEIRIVPSEEFFRWTQKNYGFTGELQLFRRNKLSDGKFKFFHYIGNKFPYLQYTFEEDFSGNLPTWILKFTWNSDRKISLKGQFCFRLQIYMKHNHDEYRRLFSKFSNEFCIVSKPAVLLKRVEYSNGVAHYNIDDFKVFELNEQSTDTAPLTKYPNYEENQSNLDGSNTKIVFQKSSHEEIVQFSYAHYQNQNQNFTSTQTNQIFIPSAMPDSINYVSNSLDIAIIGEEIVSPVLINNSRKRKRTGLNHSFDDDDEDTESPQDRAFSNLKNACDISDRREFETKRLKQDETPIWSSLDITSYSPMKNISVKLLDDDKPNSLDINFLTPQESSPIGESSLRLSQTHSSNFFIAEDESSPLGSSFFSKLSQ